MKKDRANEEVAQHWREASNYTSIASKICRKYAFAEGAVIWFIYHSYTALQFQLKPLVVVAYVSLLLFFIIDFFQYLIGHFKYKKMAEEMSKIYNDKCFKDEHYEYSLEEYQSTYNLFYLKLIPIAFATIIFIKMMFVIL